MADIHCHVRVEQALSALGIQKTATECGAGAIGGGEANEGANVGDGEGLVYRDKIGVVLNFRTLKAASPNVSIVTNGDVIEIDTLVGGGNVNGPDPSTLRGIATYGNTTGTILLDNNVRIDTSLGGPSPGSLTLRSIQAWEPIGEAWRDLVRLEDIPSNGDPGGPEVIVGSEFAKASIMAIDDPKARGAGGVGNIIHEQINVEWQVEKQGAIYLPDEPTTQRVFRLGVGGTNGAQTDIYCGSISPQGAVTAAPGSLYLRGHNALASASMYIHRGTTTTNSDWIEFSIAGGGDFSTSVSSVVDETIVIFDGTSGKLGKNSPVRIRDLTVPDNHVIDIQEPSTPFAWKTALRIENITPSPMPGGNTVILGNQTSDLAIDSLTDPYVRVASPSAATGKVIHENVAQNWNVKNEGAITTPDGDTTPPLSLASLGTNAGQTRHFVGGRDPVGNVPGNPGDTYTREGGSNSNVYVHRGTIANNTDWVALGGAGGGTSSGLYRFSTTTTDADPGAGRWRMNNATPASATFLYIDELTDEGTDISVILSKLDVGDTVYSQAQADSSIYHAFNVTGPAVDGTGYWKIPVTWDSGSGLYSNLQYTTLSFIFSGAGGGGTPNLGFYAYRTGGNQQLPFNVITTIGCTDKRDDPGADFTTGSTDSYFTCPVAGRYVFCGNIDLTHNPGGRCDLYIQSSVHGVVAQAADQSYTAGTSKPNVAATLYCDAGEIIRLQAYQNTGQPATIEQSNSHFSGSLVSQA